MSSSVAIRSVVALAASATLMAWPTAADAAPSLTATKVVHIYPFTSGGALKTGYSSDTERGATCSPGSDVAANAYRCVTRNLILDPCFAKSGQVVCQTNPFGTRLDKLPKAKIGSGSPGGKNQLWGIKLTSGATCIFISGSRSRVGTHSVAYYCNNEGMQLLDNVDRSHKVWTVGTVTSDRNGVSHQGKSIRITQADFASAPKA